MRNLIWLFVLAGSIFFIGCAQSSTDNTSTTEDTVSPIALEDKAWDEMMVVHDEVMPKMGNMNRVSRELKALSEGLTEKSDLEKVNKAVKDLEGASEGMMTWMSELQQPEKLRKAQSHEEIMSYLQGEIAEITKVKEDMLNSLEEGKKLLNELKAEKE